MSKSTRLQSRRKWALGGVGLLLGIGLITTAGATWIIGANAGSTDNNVSVAVDTVQNKSVKLTTALSDSSITLGEIKGSSLSHSGIVGFENGNGDLSITFSEIKVEYGSSFVPEDGSLKISFELRYGAEHTANAQNLVQDAGNITNLHDEAKTVDSNGGSNVDSWTYIDIASGSESITVPGTNDETWNTQTSKETGLVTATGTNITFNFAWGSFFGGMSPANYYNSNYESSTPGTTDAVNIEKELNAMKSALDGKTIVLTATVTGEAAGA